MKLRIGVDLGKTTCRVQIDDGRGPSSCVEGPGARGLAEPGGVQDAVTTIISMVTRALAAHPGGPSPGFVAVGAAGAHASAEAATVLATELARRLPAAEVAVASDSLVAHLGALDGGPGVVLVAGTGAVALAVDDAGQVFQADGWGPLLGDDGGGAWIGREALRSVLRAREHRGPETALSAAAELRFGDPERLVLELSADRNVPRALAGFVPDVVRCAEQGDLDAVEVVQRAARALAATTVAAARPLHLHTVAPVGGLTGHRLLMDAWRGRLPDWVEVVPAVGAALQGAMMLTGRTDLPHESRVVRVQAPTGPGEVDGRATVDVDTLATEQARADLADLDLRTPGELVDLLLEDEAEVPGVVARARHELTAAVALVEAAFVDGGRLIYVGAGTPGRLAAVDAAECPPTFGTDPGQVIAVLAGGEAAASAAIEGAEDDAEAGARDLDARGVTARDVVVGITASGRTAYVLAALDAARRHGARTVAVVNNPNSPARAHAEVTVELLTGPEILAGSTRLTAGAAQKIVLNTLSTSAMIRTGKTYGAWMVDMVASNEKLRRRARRILREATGVSDDDAVRVLEDSGWSTKVALVSILAGLDADAARARLAEVHGFVRAAVAQVPQP